MSIYYARVRVGRAVGYRFERWWRGKWWKEGRRCMLMVGWWCTVLVFHSGEDWLRDVKNERKKKW